MSQLQSRQARRHPEQPTAAQLAVLGRTLARLTPAHFAVHASRGTWVPYRHLLLIQEALLKVVRGEVKRLIISMPPQHGKSEFTSHYFLAWLLGSFPWLRVILASYEAEQAEGWGRKVRDTLTEHGDLFGVEVSKKSSAANRWQIAGNRGYMVSAGIGGPINGKAADIAIVDDPIKSADEAASATVRAKHQRWFANVLGTRLSKDGRVIIIQTRWHEDDLAGWVYKVSVEGGVPTLRLALPAICPDVSDCPDGALQYFGSDPLGRNPGEALCPELHPVEKLAQHKRELSETEWWGLYQQYPFSPRGGTFAGCAFHFWQPEDCPLEPDSEGVWRYKPGARKFDKIIQSWDFTYGSLTGRSWCVGQVWGRMGPDYWLLYQVRDRLIFSDMLTAVEQMTERFPMALGKLIEAKAAGPLIIRTLRRSISGILAINPEGSKPARAEAISPLLRAGNVWCPHPDLVAPWVPIPFVLELLKEFTAFPRGSTDDQVDTSSQALANLSGAAVFKSHKRKPKGL